VAVRGEGSWVYTADGRKLLDLTSGIGVTSTGHCHPKARPAAPQPCRRWLMDASRPLGRRPA
jgi:4-aminobutyrate aminotransferase